MRISSLTVLVLATLAPASARAAGESVAGFPNYRERVFHQLANRGRADPQTELAACGANCSEAACYAPTAPLLYSEQLNRAARFHADEMARQGFFAHDSICTLVDGIAAAYPDACDGSAACACAGGVSQCMPACDTAQERVARWGVAYGGEIIAQSIDPESTYFTWLFEKAGNLMLCGLHSWNANRFLLLQGGEAVGFGASNGHTVGEFGSPGVVHKIPSGIHWPREGPTVEVWANWYDPAGGPLQTYVNVDGECIPMQLDRGVADNGAYHVTLDRLGPDCHRYYFRFIDAMGDLVTYPTTGSLGIGPEDGCPDFSDERPTECGCLPNCDGVSCGDDGCGGSCGACADGERCYEGFCCQPHCEVDACGGDGCGGDCIVCDEGYTCIVDICVPHDDPSTTGANTTTDPTSTDGATSTDGIPTGTTVPSTGTSSATDTSAGAEVPKLDGCYCGAAAGAPWWALTLLLLPRRRRHRMCVESCTSRIRGS